MPVPFPIRDGELNVKFIGEMVKAKRTSAGLTIHETALLCNVPVNAMSKLENNTGGITLESFLKIANGLSLKIEINEGQG